MTAIILLLALPLEAIHLKTLKKRHFIATTTILAVGSWINWYYTKTYTILLFAFAMTLSLLGDLAMANWIKLTKIRLIDGIIFFAVAHLLYAFGALTLATPDWRLLGMVVLIIGSIGYMKVAYNPSKKTLSIGAAFYTATIMTAFGIMILNAIDNPNTTSLLQALGMALFVSSDMMIAYREFHRDFNQSERFISANYILGQLLLQLSVSIF